MTRSSAASMSFPVGDVIAILASPADAGGAATMLRGLGIPDSSIEVVGSATDHVLIVRRPGRERIAEIRRILRLHQARRARYYRALVIEELVRVTTRWLPDAARPTTPTRPATGSA